jgi:O-antigen/teichoic acid export membrane protein
VRGLRQQVVRGLLWRSGVGGSQQVLQILFTVLLARLLTTADFGIVALALTVTRLAQAVSNVQFGAALVRDKDSTDGQASAILYCQIGINLVMSVACYLAAPLAADFFHAPELEPVVAVLAWSLLLSSFAFPQIILRKRMRFGAFSALEIASMLVANVVAVVAAFAGLGVWSLVIRVMVDRVVFAAGVWWVSSWRPIRPDFRGVGQHLRIGLHLLGSNILYYVSQNAAVILIGRFAGTALTGCFNIAFTIAVAPAAQVQAILTTVLQPAFAFFQADPPVFRRKAATSMFALGLIYIPAMVGLAAVARPLILFAYGPQWEPAAYFLVPLAGVGLVKGLEHLLRSVIIAAGHSAAVLRVTAVESAAAVVCLAIGGGLGGANGLAIAYFVASVLAGVLTLRAANVAVGGGDVLLKAISRTSLAAAAMGAVVAAVAFVLPWPHGATLLVQILLGAALYFVLRVRTLTREERTFVRGLPVAGLVLARR